MISHFDYQPVEDAMPERLPHARLTTTVESSDVMWRNNQYYNNNNYNSFEKHEIMENWTNYLFDIQNDLKLSYTEKLIAIFGPTVCTSNSMQLITQERNVHFKQW